jgi:hypothetical protein
LPCSFTIKLCRSGIIISVPRIPPSSAISVMRSTSISKPMSSSEGSVKATPAASDSPAEPVVCTMLFFRIVDLPNARRMVMASTPIGIEAEVVSPILRPA